MSWLLVWCLLGAAIACLYAGTRKGRRAYEQRRIAAMHRAIEQVMKQRRACGFSMTRDFVPEELDYINHCMEETR